jgi:CRP/FNR family cyclic AMP-dependent transcriptional regulator
MNTNIFDLVGQISNKKKEDTVSFILKRGKKRVFQKEELIVTEGSFSNAVYIILTGKVQVFRKDLLNNHVIITYLSDGDIFGEMGIFLDRKRSASVISVTEVVLAEFTNAEFVKALLEIPDLMYRLFQSFAQNLTQMNDKLNRMTELTVIKMLAGHFLTGQVKDLDLPDKVTVSIKELSTELNLSSEQVYAGLQYLKRNDILEDFKVLGGSFFTFRIQKEKIFDLLKSSQLNHE